MKKIPNADLMLLFFFQAMAGAIWIVPLGAVLKAHGYPDVWPYAFGCTAFAAMLSPLIFGALADRHVAPAVVLRWLSAASGVLVICSSIAIREHCSSLLLIALMQLLALSVAPLNSIIPSIVFLRLKDESRKFGPLRSLGTLGWIAGCWLISLSIPDASIDSLLFCAATYLALIPISFLVPTIPPLNPGQSLTWHERLGLDALILLKDPGLRVVFVMCTVLCIPSAVFYPVTPLYLARLGFHHTSAWMTLGQVTEVIALISLSRLRAGSHFRGVFLAGLILNVLRFAFCAFGLGGFLLAGIALHGFSLMLVLVAAQIYLGQRVDLSWQVRAQALFGVLTTGVGSLLGFLGSGWWFRVCTTSRGVAWSEFWWGCSVVSAGILIYFLIADRDGDRLRASRFSVDGTSVRSEGARQDDGTSLS
jgi:hypothetical protein